MVGRLEKKHICESWEFWYSKWKRPFSGIADLQRKESDAARSRNSITVLHGLLWWTCPSRLLSTHTYYRPRIKDLVNNGQAFFHVFGLSLSSTNRKSCKISSQSLGFYTVLSQLHIKILTATKKKEHIYFLRSVFLLIFMRKIKKKEREGNKTKWKTR